MPTNAAAWATGTQRPLEVKEAPYTRPLGKELVVKNHAVAINPVDWIKIEMGSIMYSWIKYPFIFGYDNAGEVVEVGPSVTRFKVGDRVVGLAGGMDEKPNKSSHSSFQNYTVMQEHMTSAIPETLSFEKAVVLPLGLSTAACGMFQKDQLGLEFPTAPRSTTRNGKTLLVWGGSTSVGINAIQLAAAAGYEVYTTCSPKNFSLVKSLGATKAFDYNSRTVVPDLIHALKDKTIAGVLTMGPGSADACMDIVAHCKGNRFISMASFPTPTTAPKYFPTLVTIWSFLSWSIANWYKSKTRGVKTNFIMGSSLVENEVGPMIFEEFLPRALAAGEYVAAPDPIVVGKGLEFIQPAFEMQKKGVSAGKVVVLL